MLGFLSLRKLIFVAVGGTVPAAKGMHACMYTFPSQFLLGLDCICILQLLKCVQPQGNGINRGGDVLEGDPSASANHSGCGEWVLVRSLACTWTNLMFPVVCVLDMSQPQMALCSYSASPQCHLPGQLQLQPFLPLLLVRPVLSFFTPRKPVCSQKQLS